jgi:hypothetical protein
MILATALGDKLVGPILDEHILFPLHVIYLHKNWYSNAAIAMNRIFYLTLFKDKFKNQKY